MTWHLCVLKIRSTRLFGVSSERERSLRRLPPDVSVVKTAHTGRPMTFAFGDGRCSVDRGWTV